MAVYWKRNKIDTIKVYDGFGDLVADFCTEPAFNIFLEGAAMRGDTVIDDDSGLYLCGNASTIAVYTPAKFTPSE